MDELLNEAPCGLLTANAEGFILAINPMLLHLLNYTEEQVVHKHIKHLLTVPSKVFFEYYARPFIRQQNKVDEIYLSLQTALEKEIPVIMNAVKTKKEGTVIINYALFPIKKRSDYENELLTAKKEAEAALHARNKANADLKIAMEQLKKKQEELININKKNALFEEEMKKELILAKKVQETSLTESLHHDQIWIDAFYRASSLLSGDMYGFYHIDKSRYGVIILDVMGHGVSSALITMSLQSLFQRLISFGHPSEVIMKELDNHLHQLFQHHEETRHYCSAIYLLIDTKEQTIEFSNAGHPPAIWQQKDGKQYDIHTTSAPLGMFEETVFRSEVVHYEKGDRLLLYTDGVTDPLGFNHLKPLLIGNRGLPLPRLKELIVHSLSNEDNLQHKSDDQCFIIIDL
ncbi:SpoIIE family protein phosphatase [Metabacillus sp. HB246100]|uniref:SpoIIE family protein phosphatase n=1 Tax=Bacillus weihaiensis TaxID=1547283 RepID=UPI00235556D5|nr:SpoIIE family protein phosphatase [Bacillus weihaiensis]